MPATLPAANASGHSTLSAKAVVLGERIDTTALERRDALSLSPGGDHRLSDPGGNHADIASDGPALNGPNPYPPH